MMSNVVELLDKCERMAQHSFVREALDLINNPFGQIKCDQKAYIHAAYQSLVVDHPKWSYEITGNLPHVVEGMKRFSKKEIDSNKFTVAINELYFLNLLQDSPISKYRYLVFAYGQVPNVTKYQFHYVNKNDNYMMCASPLQAKDVIGLAERMKQHLPGD